MTSPTPPPDASAPHGPTSPDAAQTAPPTAGPDPVAPPRSGSGFFDALRGAGVARGEDRWIGGVASGVAHRLGVDPLLVRAAFAVAAIIGGLGLFVYGVAWALLPEQRDGRIHLQEAIEGRFDAALLGAGGFVLLSWASPTTWMSSLAPFNAPWFTGLTWFGLAATVVVLVVAYSQRTPPTGASPGRTGYPAGAAPSGTAHPGAPVTPVVPVTTASSAAADSSATAHRATTQSASPTMSSPITSQPAPAQPGPTQPGATPFAPSQPGHSQHHSGWQAPAPAVRRDTGGGGIFAAAAGLSLLAFAGLWYADRVDALTAPLGLTAVAVTVVLMGLATVVAGLMGRPSGAVSFVAVVGIVAGFALATAPDLPIWHRTDSFIAAGETSFTPRTTDNAAGGTSVGAGQVTADLTDLGLRPPGAVGTAVGDEPLVVPISVALGEVLVTVPADVAYRLEVSVAAGEIVNRADPEDPINEGVGVSTVFENDAARIAGEADLVVRASVLAGTVTITEETP